MNKLTISLVYYPSKLYYSGAYTTLSMYQVMKRPFNSLSLQRPRDNAVSSFIANTNIKVTTCV